MFWLCAICLVWAIVLVLTVLFGDLLVRVVCVWVDLACTIVVIVLRISIVSYC